MLPLIVTQPATSCTVSVVIPARNEARTIQRTLTALAEQHNLAGERLPRDSYEIILLANNCDDDTAGVARRLAATFPDLALHVIEIDLPSADAHVGVARRLGMDEAWRRLMSLGMPRGIIATTDADTIVTPTWIAATLREVQRGAEAVGGRIMMVPEERRAMPAHLRQRFLRHVGYYALAHEAAARIDPRPVDPWPCHEQFSGASLAVTADAYQQIGGLPPLPTGEDAALGRALYRADIEVRHSPAVRVHTSGRLDGRAPDGMAALLASWSTSSAAEPLQLVPDAASVIASATCRRALRDLWKHASTNRDLCTSEVARLAQFAGVPEQWLARLLLDSLRFGTLTETVQQQARWHLEPVLVDVRTAIADLRAWLAPYRRCEAQPPMFARHMEGLPFEPPLVVTRRRRALSRPPSVLTPREEIQPIPRLASPPQVA